MSGALPGLRTEALGRKLIWLDEVGSTNDYLKQRAHELPHGTAVIAHLQSGGKGRLGRSWEVPRGKSLSMSVLLNDRDITGMGTLPLEAALAVRRALHKLCGIDFAIKWPNDVLCGDRKLCGILCESRIAGAKAFAVTGIGVNVTQNEADFARHGLVYAGSLLLATQKTYEIPAIAAAIMGEMEQILQKTRENGFRCWLDEYRAHCVTLDKQVRVLRDGRESVGRAVDIGADGSLLCELDGELTPILAGEASVRGLLGYTR